MKIQKLSLVLSCLNEEKNVERFSEEIIQFLKNLNIPHELILVDDGSTDDTWGAIKKLSEKIPHIVSARHIQNKGLGAGLRTGFSLATGDAIVTLDADLTFHPREIPKLLAAFDESIDMVIGSAFLGTMEGVLWVRKLLSSLINNIYSALFGNKISAVSSIFRLYRSSFLKTLDLTSTSFDINAEILFKGLQKGARVIEIPTTLTKRIHGVSKINIGREALNHLQMITRIIFWKMGYSKKHGV